MDFSRFCTPAQLYLILAGISLITAFFNNFQVITLVLNGIFVLIWGWILNWLCSKGLKAISWILVLLPFILFFFTFFFAIDIMSNAAHAEGFCTADDVSKIETAFSALQSSLQNKPQQSEIQSALTTFKSTLDGITTEAKVAAATSMPAAATSMPAATTSMPAMGGGTSSVKEGYSPPCRRGDLLIGGNCLER